MPPSIHSLPLHFDLHLPGRCRCSGLRNFTGAPRSPPPSRCELEDESLLELPRCASTPVHQHQTTTSRTPPPPRSPSTVCLRSQIWGSDWLGDMIRKWIEVEKNYVTQVFHYDKALEQDTFYVKFNLIPDEEEAKEEEEQTKLKELDAFAKDVTLEYMMDATARDAEQSGMSELFNKQDHLSKISHALALLVFNERSLTQGKAPWSTNN